MSHSGTTIHPMDDQHKFIPTDEGRRFLIPIYPVIDFKCSYKRQLASVIWQVLPGLCSIIYNMPYLAFDLLIFCLLKKIRQNIGRKSHLCTPHHSLRQQKTFCLPIFMCFCHRSVEGFYILTKSTHCCKPIHIFK